MASNETSDWDLDVLIQKAMDAQRIYAAFSQEQVDEIFRAAASAAGEKSFELAEMAVNETGMGVVKDKVTKNKFAAEFIYDRYKNEKTCGVISYDPSRRLKIVADPVGLIAAVTPTTNPTSTAIFKTLLALKTRNGIIFSPHPRAKKCTTAAAKIVLDAAVRAGAPQGIIAWIGEPTLELTNALIQHHLIQLILATGGPGMVKAAYSSGRPSIGVGSGNAPAIIDETADIPAAVSAILLSKTFDNGVICASEQSIVAVASVYGTVKAELTTQGAYVLNEEESAKVGKIILNEKGAVNAAIAGQSAHAIGKLAGIDVPTNTRVLISEEESCTAENPYAHEKLSPILAFFKAKNFEEAVDIGVKLTSLGGLGHTSVLHTNTENQQRVDHFALKMPTGRVLINAPASQGAIGLCNDGIAPSLSIGCGTWGGNSTSENIGVKHLLNYKTVAENRS